jgi:hypothetical protein
MSKENVRGVPPSRNGWRRWPPSARGRSGAADGRLETPVDGLFAVGQGRKGRPRPGCGPPSRGPPGAAQGKPPPGAFLSRTRRHARPRRLRVRYERAGRSSYSAAAAGGAKMTAAQIAEARRMAGVKAEVCRCDSAPCSARRMAFEMIHSVAGDYPEVGLSSSSVGRR